MHSTEHSAIVVVTPQQRDALAALLLHERTSIERLLLNAPTSFPPEMQQQITARCGSLAVAQSLYDAIVAGTSCRVEHMTVARAPKPGLLQSAATAGHHSPAVDTAGAF